MQREMREKTKCCVSDAVGPETETPTVYQGKWVHWEKMSFLRPTIEARNTSSNLDNTAVYQRNSVPQSGASSPPQSSTSNLRQPTISPLNNFTDGVPNDTFDDLAIHEDEEEERLRNQLLFPGQNLSNSTPTTPRNTATVTNGKDNSQPSRKRSNIQRAIDIEEEKLKVLRRREKERKSEKEQDQDADLHFAKSIVPYLKLIPISQKIKAQQEIMDFKNDASIRSPTVAEANRKHAAELDLEINTTTYPTFPAYRNLHDRLKTYEKWPKDFRLKPDALSNAGFFYIGQERKTTCYQCGGTINWNGSETDPYTEHERFFRKCFHLTRHKTCREYFEISAQVVRANQSTPQRPDPSQQQCTKINAELESERLKTFDDWNVPFVNKHELVEVGFYYTRNSDVVACYKCHKYVRNWKEGDVPAAEHLKHSPECSLAPLCKEILERKSGGMQPLLRSSVVNGGGGGGGAFDTCGLFEEPNQQPAKYPTYRSFEQRKLSFDRWPGENSIRPETLWKAGFFYAGIEDCCVCFHCGTGLKRWENKNDPWIEHSIWHPQCEYLVSKKGSAFVNEVDDIHPDTIMLYNEETERFVDSLQSLSYFYRGRDVIENRNVSSSNRIGDIANIDDNEDSVEKDDNDNSAEKIDKKCKPLCNICFARGCDKFLFPCGHVTCDECAENLVLCAFCRKSITDKLTMYIP